MNKKALLLLLFSAFILRLAAVVITGDDALDWEWNTLIRNLLEGRGYSYYSLSAGGEVVHEFLEHPARTLPSAHLPIGYAALLYPVTAVFGYSARAIKGIEVFQAALGALECLLVYYIGSLTFNRRVAMLGAIIFCLYPLDVYKSGQISPVNLYALVNLALVALLLRGEASGRARDFILAGLAGGMYVLFRSEAIVMVPLIALWIWWRAPVRGRSHALVFLVMAVLVMLPWGVRNYKAFGRMVPLSTNAGYNLWNGQFSGASGTRTYPEKFYRPEMRDAIRNIPPERDYEVRLNRIYMQEALREIAADPLGRALLSARKFFYYWAHPIGEKAANPGTSSPLYWLPWIIMLPFFLLGLLLTLRDWPRYSLYYMNLIVPTLVVMVFFVLARFRLFVLPYVVLIAAYGMVHIHDRLRAVRKPLR